MANLTPAQLEQLAYNAGFRGNDLKMAVAVAIGESGGNPMAYNPEAAAGTRAGSGSRGLWQIYGTAHPQYNNSGTFDPQTNANAAYTVYRNAGSSFRPWSVWLNGSAQRIAQSLNLPNITSVTNVTATQTAPKTSTAAYTPPAPSNSAATQPTNTQPMNNLLSSVPSAVIPGLGGGDISSLLPDDFGLNLSLGFAGVVLVIFGFVLLARSM